MNLADIRAGCRFIRAVEFKVSTGDDERTTLVSSVSSDDTYRRDLLDRDISESSVIEGGGTSGSDAIRRVVLMGFVIGRFVTDNRQSKSE
jgi:hypothetical protein